MGLAVGAFPRNTVLRVPDAVIQAILLQTLSRIPREALLDFPAA